MINPEPSTSRCLSRGCDTIPHSPCLNAGICTAVSNAEDLRINCSCPSNYFGIGCQYFDECSTNPCMNGGECLVDLSNSNQFICTCNNEFDGDRCQNRISPCLTSPCFNKATCVESTDGGFECACLPGFTGMLCNTDINECENNPCENNGVCNDGVNSFTCSCPPEFSGPVCSIQVVFCSPDACQNGGTCIETDDSFVCSCPPGYTGSTCSEDVDECQVQNGLCQNGSSCIDIPGSFACFCAPGFTGSSCDTRINFCSNDSCTANGVCLSLDSGFVCQCSDGFTGERCEVNINDCDPNPCLNGGTCIDTVGFFMCLCETGFTGDVCGINIDACQSSPCDNGGTCTDLFGESFSCDCPSGFSGAMCEIQTDFCIDQTCYNGGTCISNINTFTCMCQDGWTGDQCQFPINIVAKLDSCGFTMARDMLAGAGLVESSEPLSISSGSPPVSFSYNLADSMGIYFSGWIWQQDDTNSVLFSFTDSEGISAGQLISDLNNQELRFYYYSNVTGQNLVLSATFVDLPIHPNTWMHIAFAAFSDNSVFINIDGTFSQNSSLDGVNADLLFSVPPTITVNFARGTAILSSLDSAVAFSGLVRGVAINRITTSSSSFNLHDLQNCTLNCIGGESFCSPHGQCQDLFGPNRRCSCPYGFTGLQCQYTHDRFSFNGSGFAQFADSSVTFERLQLSFKTDQTSGELYSHTHPSVQTQIQLRDSRNVGITRNYCDDTSERRDLLSPLYTLNDLQYHTLTVSNTLQLDGYGPESFPLILPSCNTTFMPSVIFGSFDVMDQRNRFQGCMKDIFYDGVQVDTTLLRFSKESQFGCSRDTAQFYTFSHLELPQFISRESHVISLEFSTHAPTGILYFSARTRGDATGSDFIALHIVNREAVFTLNLGEQSVALRSNTSVNDGQWHSITAVQNGTMAFLYLDGELMQGESMGPLVLLDTTGNVFIGGVPSVSRISSFSSYTGFDGCVRDLEQNQVAADMQNFILAENIRFGVCN